MEIVLNNIDSLQTRIVTIKISYLYRRTLRMNNKLMGLIAVVVAVIAGALMMAGGGGAKPEDSFEQIKAAAANKDVAGVEK